MFGPIQRRTLNKLLRVLDNLGCSKLYKRMRVGQFCEVPPLSLPSGKFLKIWRPCMAFLEFCQPLSSDHFIISLWLVKLCHSWVRMDYFSWLAADQRSFRPGVNLYSAKSKLTFTTVSKKTGTANLLFSGGGRLSPTCPLPSLVSLCHAQL